MKKVLLSTLASMTLSGVAYAEVASVTDSTVAESAPKKKSVSLFSHADKFKVSGQTFIGYKNTDFKDETVNSDSQDFEIRRGYFQVKAYLLDDPKSYYRITMDLTRESVSGTNVKASTNGSMIVRAKYAYLNLNEVLPATSFEIGLAHRPWHDYEEHNSWLYRSISEVLIENHNSAHLSSSADFGVMAKTRTKFFDADIGIFNGEGYHSAQVSNGMSLEWRFTGHLLGTHGHPEKNTYLDASFFGQLNQKHSGKDSAGNPLVNPEDLHFYGLHTVFNMPAFLVSAQYVTSTDTSDVATHTSAASGDGYSANTEIRLGDAYQYKLLAKYDNWTPDVISGATAYTRITEIVGVAWKQNKNVEWVANATINDDEDDHYNSSSSTANGTAYMLTAEVTF